MVQRGQHECETQSPLTDDNIAAAIERIALIRNDIQGAINCWSRMVTERRLNDRDLRMALRKYVEDVGESVKVLDCGTGHGLLDALIEFEEWKGLKGIRDIIAHQPGRVDDVIVVDAVVTDFPVLSRLLAGLLVCRKVLDGDDTWELPVGKFQAVHRTAASPLYQSGKHSYSIAAAHHRVEGWLVERIVIINHQGELSHRESFYDDSNPYGTRMRVRGRVPKQLHMMLTAQEAEEIRRKQQERKS